MEATRHLCARHPEQSARNVCERCGDFLCARCLWVLEDRIYCDGCADLLRSRGALFSQREAFLLPRAALTSAAGALAGSAVAVTMLTQRLPSGPHFLFRTLLAAALAGGLIGFWQSGRALARIRRQPALPGRGLAWAAMALGIAAVGLAAAGIARFS